MARPKKTEATTIQRRDNLLKEIMDKGHPNLIDRELFSKKYNVTPMTISNDIKYLAEEIKKGLGDEAELITKAIYQKAVKEYIKVGKYREAWQIADGYNGWLFDLGIKQKAPEKVEVTGTPWDRVAEINERRKKEGKK